MCFLNPKTFMLPSNDINRVWITKPSNSYWVGSKDYYLSIVKLYIIYFSSGFLSVCFPAVSILQLDST